MKNDEIKNANRKALPMFLLALALCMVIGGAAGYCAAKYGLDGMAGTLKDAGAFFGTHIAPWLILALAVIVPVVCIPIFGKCAFKAYSATNVVCAVLAIVLAVCALVFDIGFLPSLTVCLVWIVNISAYCKEAMRYSIAGNKIS